ncbi:MAG: HAMP domain-containing sensor histidine kinase, partial [Oenococcus sp.]
TMNKAKINLKQYVRLFFLEAIGFLMIFSFVGGYIYFTYTRSVQENFDQILSTMVMRVQRDSQLSGVKRLTIPGRESNDNDPSKNSPAGTNPVQGVGVIQPDVAGQDTIYYDKDGNIINYNSLGLRYFTYENLYKKIMGDFSTTQAVKLGGSYFRVRLIRLRKPVILVYNDQKNDSILLGKADYAAVTYNFDSELANIESFRSVLLWSLLFAAVLSLVVSWLVTLRVMKPILQSWKQQQDFVNNAAHELRTPLTIIQNKLENLLRTPTKPVADVSENIVVSLSEVRRLNQLTSDMLTLAKTGSNMSRLDPKTIDVKKFIDEVVEPYSEIAQSENKVFNSDINVKGQMTFDNKRVHQLIVILLDNALKYTDEKGSITLKARRDKNNLILEVADTGRGISQEAKRHVFDRFYREEKSGNRNTGGTGLGLSIAKWIVDAFKGKITVSDNYPEGSVFKVVLPKLKATH